MIHRRPADHRARSGLRRKVARVVAVTVAVAVVALVAASPAFAAAHPDDGSDPGPGLTGLQTVLIFVVIPLAACALISLFAVAPTLGHGPRYRPGLGWWAAPVWFNGPDDPEAALREVESRPAADLDADAGGGASARW